MQLSLERGQGQQLRVRLLAFLFAEMMVLGFAVSGPDKPLGMAVIAVSLLLIILLLPKPPIPLLFPILAICLLTPQIAPGVNLYDFIGLSLGALALIVTFLREDRRAWDVRTPGVLCAIALVIPLIASFSTTVSVPSFLGAYKTVIVWVCVFFAFRRLVRPEASNLLLWVFPFLGTVAAVQVLVRVRDIGALVYSRMDYRNFYTGIGWGASNYVAGLLLVCLLGTVVLLLLDRRLLARLALAGAMALMLQTFVILFSRGATVALLVAGLVFVVGWRGKLSLIALGAVAVLGTLFVGSPAGQTLLLRFQDPREYASMAQRVEIWDAAWQRFLSHPLTGIGLNQGRYQGDGLGGSEAHNFLLNVLGEQGILGGLFYVVIVIAAYRLALRAKPAGLVGSPKPVRIALLAMITATLVHAMVEPTLSGYVVGLLFVWLLAWLTLQDPSASRTHVQSA